MASVPDTPTAGGAAVLRDISLPDIPAFRVGDEPEPEPKEPEPEPKEAEAEPKEPDIPSAFGGDDDGWNRDDEWNISGEIARDGEAAQNISGWDLNSPMPPGLEASPPPTAPPSTVPPPTAAAAPPPMAAPPMAAPPTAPPLTAPPPMAPPPMAPPPMAPPPMAPPPAAVATVPFGSPFEDGVYAGDDVAFFNQFDADISRWYRRSR